MPTSPAKRRDAAPESRLVPVGRLAKSLPEQVAEQLLAAIEDGALKPGQRLKEESFSERFAVSRSTLREAMALLERRGVVERIPRYGVRIVSVDAAEIEEIFNIRAQLLGLAARLTADMAPDDVRAAFEQQVQRLERLAANARTTPSNFAGASIEAQRLLIAASSVKRLRIIYEELSEGALWRHFVRGRSISFQTAQRRSESAGDWRRVSDAIARRDGDGAERHAKSLLQASYRAVKSQL
jgi:DNA-binding GntR family transcriptional regulator